MDAKGVIFDLDGVLLDSAEYHRRSWYRLAAEISCPMSDAFFHETFGMTNSGIIPRMKEGFSVDEIARLSERKEALFREEAGGRLELFPGVARLIHDLRSSGWKTALGTSTPRSNVDFFRRELGFDKLFDVFACMEDVRRGKPDPEVFLVAASRIGVPPIRCVVVEDSFAGIAAAKAAGMGCVAVATTNTAERLRSESRADTVVGATGEITPEIFGQVLSKMVKS